MSSKKVISGGFSLMQYARAHTTGYPAGTTGTIANGGDAGMSRLYGVKQASVSIPEAVRATQTGDDNPQGSLVWPTTELPGGNLQTGIFDEDFDAIAQGTLAYTLSGMRIGVLSPADPEYADLVGILSRPAKSKDSATTGRKRWQHYLLPAFNAVPRGTDSFQERTFGNNVYDITCNPATKFPWGDALDATNVGTTETPVFVIHTDYRLTMHTFVGDGADTAFTLSKLPAGDEATDYFDLFAAADGSDANGLLDSVNTSTGVVTFTAAPSAGVVYTTVYQYQNE